MLLKHAMLFFIFYIVGFSVIAQKLTNDKHLILQSHPNEDGKFIAKFLDKQSMKIVEHWEMRSSVEEVNAEIFNELLQKQKIYPDGVCYKFYPKMKIKSESHYEYGKKIGIEKGFYPDKKVKYKANYYGLQEGITEHFYKNGLTRKIENYTRGRLNGELSEFYTNGNKKTISNYENGRLNGKYQSYYKNGSTKRKAKFKNGKEISVKCYNINGENIAPTPFIINTEYLDGINALRAELNKIDFSFNTENTDTTNFRIILDIDTLGLAVCVNYHFKHSDTLQAKMQEWGNTLKQFSPTIIDGISQSSYLNISIAVSSNKIVWLGEPTLNYDLFNLNAEIEKRPTLFWEYPNPGNDEIYFVVDNLPYFPGGGQNLRNYIGNHINYPVEAQKRGIQGKVYVSFIVEKDGSVTNAKIVKSIHPLLDNEALRIISHLPNWQPGSQRGKPVRVSYTVPINFALNRNVPMQTSRTSTTTRF